MNKNIKSPLPIVFICGIIIVAILNMNTFTTTYKTKIIEAEVTNKQTALSSLETEYQNNIIGKTNYLDLNGLFSRIIDKIELNGRYKLINGHLTSSNSYLESSLDDFSVMNAEIKNITNLKYYLDLYDIPFAYIQTPHLLATDYDPMIPIGYETHINSNTDRLLEGLLNNNVSYLDLRENFKQDNLDHFDYFYKTDHHWNSHAGFISHKYISEFIDEQLGEKISNDDYFILNRYEIEVFKNISLGYHGQSTGILFSGLDDISVITPNFFTEFIVEAPSLHINKTGNFKESQINYNILENNLINPFNRRVYLVYPLHTNYAKITNLNAKNDKVILLLRDSFTCNLAPFLALHYKEVHLCDVRYGDKQDGFIKVLHEVNPDIVLQVRITSNVLTDDAKALI